MCDSVTEGRLLGVDYGSKRIGVAISDGLRMLAHPLTTIEGENEDDRIEQLARIVDEHRIVAVVVGMPLTCEGKEGTQANRVRAFIAKLAQRVSVPIRTWDERLTTEVAHKQLRSVGRRPSKARNIVDQLAAVEILQSYLDWLRTRSATGGQNGGQWGTG